MTTKNITSMLITITHDGTEEGFASIIEQLKAQCDLNGPTTQQGCSTSGDETWQVMMHSMEIGPT